LPSAAAPVSKRIAFFFFAIVLSFELTEPEAYRRDVPKAEVHVLEAGHFALDTAADEIAQLVRAFRKWQTVTSDEMTIRITA
jgi:hypothetical protein